jgi:glycosyltransferase involved in cell wall biosynthesis
MQSTKILILIPVYNEELYLHRAISSVLSQDLKDLKIVISDNYSSDRTLDVIDKLQDIHPSIQVIRPVEHMAWQDHWNWAVNFVTSNFKFDFFHFLAGDDYFACSNYLSSLSSISSEDRIVAPIYCEKNVNGIRIHKYSRFILRHRLLKLLYANLTGEFIYLTYSLIPRNILNNFTSKNVYSNYFAADWWFTYKLAHYELIQDKNVVFYKGMKDNLQNSQTRTPEGNEKPLTKWKSRLFYFTIWPVEITREHFQVDHRIASDKGPKVMAGLLFQISFFLGRYRSIILNVKDRLQ